MSRQIRTTIEYRVPLSKHWEELLEDMGDDGVEVEDPEEAFAALDAHLDEFEYEARWRWYDTDQPTKVPGHRVTPTILEAIREIPLHALTKPELAVLIADRLVTVGLLEPES